MLHLLKKLWADDSGQGLTEYASIIALVSVALLLVLVAFRDELGRIFNAMRTELNSQTGNITQVDTT
jgi:pilus assembly protein Flp/PilA